MDIKNIVLFVHFPSCKHFDARIKIFFNLKMNYLFEIKLEVV